MNTLTTADLNGALQYFAFAHNRVVDATTGLSDAQWRFKPAPDRWSIAENLEHMIIVQERVLGPVRENLAKAPAPPPGRAHEVVDALVVEKIPDRSIKAKAPDPVAPTGNWTLAESLDRLSGNYERLADFLTSTPDLRGHILESPPLRIVTNGAHNTADGYQWALTVAAHDERHVRQILEIKADPSYPAA
jgi:hypothetical protein